MEKFLNKWEILITIIISITSIFLAIKANEMTKIQTEVARNSSLPNIQVVEKNLINEKTGKTDDSIIQISYLNGRLNNYESRIVTFLKCSYLDNKNNVYEEEIPIFNYYIIGRQSGNTEGILEEKITGKNSNKIKKMMEKILQYNDSDSSLYVEIESYLCVSYIDILGEKHRIYYLTDVFESKLITEKEGHNKFEIYDKLFSLNEGIDPNREEEIDIQGLINKIYEVSNLNIGKVVEKNEIQNKGMADAMTEIMGVFLASILAHVLWIVQERRRNKESKSHAASILYYDLKSIEGYLVGERSSVNLRYSSEWQQMVAGCSFLKDEQVKELYNIYDEVYNYNYFYKLKEDKKEAVIKEDIPQYKALKNVFLNESEDNTKYAEILKELRAHIMVSNMYADKKKRKNTGENITHL